MKTLAYILLISFFSTVADPFIGDLHACEESMDMHAEKSCCQHPQESEECDNDESKDESKGDDDMNHKCSLLCQCDCCGHVTVFSVEFFSIVTQADYTIYKPVFSESYHYDLIKNIWQPPRQVLS